MPRKEIQHKYKVRTKEEFKEIIKRNNSISGALKELNCNRRSLMIYFERYNVDFPNKWQLETKLINVYLRSAMKNCKTKNIEDIIDALDDVLPECLKFKLKYKQAVEAINKLLEEKDYLKVV